MHKKHMKGRYKHTKQGATVKGFPGSAGGAKGIAHQDSVANRIHGKRMSIRAKRRA